MIWETNTTGVKNDRQIFINQLYSHDDMVVIGRQAHIIQRSGKSVDVRKFSNEFPKTEKVTIVDAALEYD